VRRGAALVLAACALAACTRGDGGGKPAFVEAVRLITAAPAEVVLYTLADETRPVLSAPPEARLQLTVAAGTRDLTVPVPQSIADAAELVVSGAYTRAKRVYPLQPTVVSVSDDAAGGRVVALPVPAFARAAGPPTQFTLVLTRPPASRVVEERGPAFDVGSGARLHFAYGVTEAALAPGSAPVSFEVVAAGGDGPEQVLWSTVVTTGDVFAARWRSAVVDLAPVAGRRITPLFRARAAGDGRPIVVPVWGDPTMTARGTRPPERRNVILISLDTLRADRVGVYGAYRPTSPALDAFAARSAVFTSGWSAWPETSGSHMTIFSSRYPSEHGVTGFLSAPAATIELLAERLRREGYLTRAFTENGGVWAFAGFARGFSAYAERRSPDFVYRGEAAATFADAARWLQGHHERNFFLFVHTYQVHAPYRPPPEYATLFADVPAREPAPFAEDALAYDREARFMDDELAKLLATVDRLGIGEDTIVIITSDHGEEFGEHGGIGHGRTLHREVLQVPLIVFAPAIATPRRVDTPASLIDVAPTVLDLLGIAPDPGYRGTSLAPALRGEPMPADRAVFGEVDRVERQLYRQLSVRKEGRTAITDLVTNTTRCFAADDPAEQRPSATCPDLEALIAEHRRAVQPVTPATPQVVDPALVEKMRALGYIE
jgi:arylsulfatase A-like enzyme